jgi:hypothetical protein
MGKIVSHLGDGGTGNGDEKAGVVLNPEILEEISVTVDGNRDPGTGGDGTIDGLENRLNGEVSVTAIDALEESNLGLTCKVDILGAVGNKLHKSSSHF